MTEYVTSALFVHTEDTTHLIKPLQNNSSGTRITPVAFDALMQTPQKQLEGVAHVVVAGPLDVIKEILRLAMKHQFSIGIIPTKKQKHLIKFYDLPKNPSAAVELALRQDGQTMDLILCNGKIMLFKAAIGRIPFLDTPAKASWIQILLNSLRKFVSFRLYTFKFGTAGKKEIDTAASGCMILQHFRGSFASRLISHDHSFTDGMASLVISAPISIIEYVKLLRQALRSSKRYKKLPSSIGYIKSPQIDIESEIRLEVFIDDQHATHTPLHCEAIAKAVHVNVGKNLRVESSSTNASKEKIDINNLPRKKELFKAKKQKRIPFFSYASDERFHDLFPALREDARLNSIYLVLMVLSTMLAAIGLYLNSASVIIGAMLLAPLMTPIVSLSMGILRGNIELFKDSIGKIVFGILIALLSSALITFLFPHKPITDEMLARMNPTLLDLGVAIISGIAAAYSKSFKEIIQSLAGVAIAVALVPPLTVAGIGIGRWDFYIFYQAFLLFSTNLVGIIIAATYTFRILGYSAAVRSRGSIGVVFIFLVLISIPLYLTYFRIVEDRVFEQSWQKERFLVNEKYLIIRKASIFWRGDKRIILMEILAREPLTREDLTAFKKKIQANFNKKLIIRIKTFYIP
ncbi:MAG: TIGR00341 family protein [Desulfobacterales bacterium]